MVIVTETPSNSREADNTFVSSNVHLYYFRILHMSICIFDCCNIFHAASSCYGGCESRIFKDLVQCDLNVASGTNIFSV